MGWGQFEDPQERKAAAEAAQKISEIRALEDERNYKLAHSILSGLTAIADAILVASGLSTHERDAFFAGMPDGAKPAVCTCGEPGDSDYCPVHADDGTNPSFSGGVVTASAELDDLINPED